MKPLIGISGNRATHPSKLPGPLLHGIYLSDDYARGVEAAGGMPVVLPFVVDASTIEAMADKLDGLLLSGGDDVNPALFDEEPRIGLGDITPDRDALEIALLRAMYERGKPVFGICRGMQLINAAFGGSLYQDLPREWHGTTQHGQRAPRTHLSHHVKVAPQSRLAELLELNSASADALMVRVNTFHHQAVKDVAPGFVATAHDSEGLIEAIEMPQAAFLVAVQWHPENLWAHYDMFRGLFRGFVEAAKAPVKLG